MDKDLCNDCVRQGSCFIAKPVKHCPVVYPGPVNPTSAFDDPPPSCVPENMPWDSRVGA